MSQAVLISNARVISPTGTWARGWLLAHDGVIARMGRGSAPAFPDARGIDAAGKTLLPGFIDLHVHGGIGHEVMDAAPDKLRELARFYARHGVTSFLPTTWTDSRPAIQAALEVVAELQGPVEGGATILGTHLEGPYLDVAKCGAQNPEQVRRADRDEALSFLDLDTIRLVALAPEYPENHWLISECIRRGITVSVAHSSATYEQIQQAAALGLSQATHTFNGMVGIHHRDPGTAGAVMALPEIRCELIADNIHIHPVVMKLLYAVKGPQGVILITDATRGAGLADGDYPIDRERIIHIRDGVARLPDGTLAGSTITINRAVYNFMQATGEPLEVIWPASSLNAARAINVAHRKGSLETGKDADLVLVDDEINVHLTMTEGRIVYHSQG
jgi:N-acetylglucosamine-6-phosphate deacetylase